jgi:uncharacterized protein YutE (UPF0331/DUF86 family)
VDIASHVIADEGWPPAGTLADAFARLAEHGVISTKTKLALTCAFGLRNVVAGIDPVGVHAAVTLGVADLDTFAVEVASWTTSHP